MWQGLFLRIRFFQGLGLLALLFCLCYFLPSWALFVCQLLLLTYLSLSIADGIFLFSRKNGIEAHRHLGSVLSLGSENPVRYQLVSRFPVPVSFVLIDELPVQFQDRHSSMKGALLPGKEIEIQTRLVPKMRGKYGFGDLLVFVQSRFGLVERRIRISAQVDVLVYPSLIEMRKHQLLATQRLALNEGIRKVRRVGHTYEFDHIKDYARGDDPRSINWKATSKVNRLMVNHYDDEKSQQVYTILDLGRNMHSPFNGMSLLDYAVNTSLALSAVILKKDDKAGLIALGDKSYQFVQADRGQAQMSRLMNVLYNAAACEGDGSMERLFHLVRSHIRNRSLLIYFTNIESLNQLERIHPYLERMQSRHLLVVVLFENEEVVDFTRSTQTQLSGIYAQTIARKYLSEKQQIAHRLRKSGIYTILTQPRQLTIDSINQYLELKARGLV
jgi:uncharacterized protein (DUF58 family)